jgi:hypothetical protein
MPKGGRREGAGRKPGSLQKRHKVVVEDPTGLMPVEWMLAVLRDPECEQSRRDQMAIQAAPYLHPRLAAASITTNGNGRDYNGGGDINIVQIYAVPHGGRIADDGSITIDGGPVTELSSVEPYPSTPALTDQREMPAPVAEPLPVIEVDTTNVTPMRRREEP